MIDYKYEIEKKMIHFWFWFVKHTPKKIRYWMTMQTLVEVTSSKYNDDNIPAVTLSQILERM